MDLGGSGVDLRWIWVDMVWILGGSGVDLEWIRLDMGGICDGFGVDPRYIWVDLGWIWSGSGWIWGGFWWILGGSWVDLGWMWGGIGGFILLFDRSLCDVEKYLKMYRPRILIEGARFPPFGFDITEMSSNSYENNVFSEKTFSWIFDRFSIDFQ